MAPYNFIHWTERAADDKPELIPHRKYCFICEGQKTEAIYFKSLCDNRNDLGISPLLDIFLLERTGNEAGHSDPIKLIEQADHTTNDPSVNFNTDLDIIVLVFDLDIYVGNRKDNDRYRRIINDINSKNYKSILGLTNPNFELFLLLHDFNAYTQIVLPHACELLAKKPQGREQHVSADLVQEKFDIESKSDPKIGDFVHNVKIAIQQERGYISQDLAPAHALKQLTSTVGKCIQEIMNDTPTNIHGGPAPATTYATP